MYILLNINPQPCLCLSTHSPLPPRRVGVLNDFEAVGYGIPALGRDDLVSLNPKAVPVDKVRGARGAAVQGAWGGG